MTSGNHIWDKKEALDYIGIEPRLLRPANYPAGAPGNGRYLARTDDGRAVGVVNVMGRVFMANIDDPFAVVLKEIEALRERARIVFVDFHAEATSEKMAMGWHLDGRVTAVVGTHTHVQTADERVLPKGTAYITDVGMTGPHDSIIGVDIEAALGRFLHGDAGALRNRDRQSAPARGHRRGRRADGPGRRHRAAQPRRVGSGGARREVPRLLQPPIGSLKSAICNLQSPAMSDLFDLPFEEERAGSGPRRRRWRRGGC